jgi:hypothetical protein
LNKSKRSPALKERRMLINKPMVHCHSNVNLFTPTHRYGREKFRERKNKERKKKVITFQTFYYD